MIFTDGDITIKEEDMTMKLQVGGEELENPLPYMLDDGDVYWIEIQGRYCLLSEWNDEDRSFHHRYEDNIPIDRVSCAQKAYIPDWVVL